MFQIKIEHCLRDELEPIEFVLEEHHSLSITLTDEEDAPILEPSPGTTPLWPKIIIHALYATQDEAQQTLQALQQQFPHLQNTLECVVQKDWERIHQDDFHPQCFADRLWIYPSWHALPSTDLPCLILDPGLAFGTGKHPTTLLCLQQLAQLSLDSLHVIDYGCGSGILALAALKLGASIVEAVDIDEQALLATKNNAEQNGLHHENLSINFPEALESPADLLIANILLGPLIELKERFAALLKTSGTLILSGVLEEQVPQLIASYPSHFYHQKTDVLDGWAVVRFNKRSPQ